jgi:hypothetical protein
MNVRPYEVEFLGKASQIPDDLWDTCFHPPGEGRWWYQALEQSGIDDQFTLFYALIKDLGSPVGIAPLFVMDIPVEQVAPQEFLRLLRLMGPYLSALRSSMKPKSPSFPMSICALHCSLFKSRWKRKPRSFVLL